MGIYDRDWYRGEEKNPLIMQIIMKNAWKNYDSTFDEEATNRYRKYL
jgi:hypothetical protein